MLHRVQSEINQIGKSYENIKSINTEHTQQISSRIEIILPLIKHRLTKANMIFIHEAHVTNLTNCNTHMRNFVSSNGNISYFNNVMNGLDQVQNIFFNVIPSLSKRDIRISIEKLMNEAGLIKSNMEKIKNDTNDIKTETQKIQKVAENTKNKIISEDADRKTIYSSLINLQDEVITIKQQAETARDDTEIIKTETQKIREVAENTKNEIISEDADKKTIYSNLINLRDKMKSMYKDIISSNSTINKEFEDIKVRMDAITNFETEYIYGQAEREDSKTGTVRKAVISKKEEIDTNFKNIKEKFNTEEIKLNEYIDEKKKEIEKILGSSTTASLAEQYLKLKNDAWGKKESAGKFFVGTIIAGIGFTLLFFGTELLNPTQNIDTHFIITSLSKISILGFIIWYAAKTMKNQNQYFRLEQEYSHKLAIAKSYEGYRHQIESFIKNYEHDSDNAKELMRLLMEKSIIAMSDNSAKTLSDSKVEIPVEALMKNLKDHTNDLINKVTEK